MRRSLRFYRDLLGFELTYAFPEEGEPAFGSLELEGGTIGLAATEGPIATASIAIWLYCDDVDAAVEDLRREGVPVIGEPADQPWGERVASVRDPDGYTVHIGTAAA